MIASLTVKILFLIGAGYLAARCGILGQEGRNALSALLVNMILPISMLSSSQDTFSYKNVKELLLVGIIALAYYLLMFVLAALVRRIFDIEDSVWLMGMLLVTFANTGFVGMPLVKELAGDTGMLYGAVYNVVFDLLYFSYGIFLLEGRGKAGSIKAVVKSPVIWASVASVILYVMPFRLPALAKECLVMVSDLMMPISMLVIGSQLSQMHFSDIFRNKTAYFFSFLRMLVIPAATYVIMVLLNMPARVTAVVVLLGAMPSGSLNVIMAEKYQIEPRLATATVMQNTWMMIVTLPLVMCLLNAE